MATNKSEDNRERFFELMRRFNQLGTMLPSDEQIEDGEQLDEAKLILSEMKSVKAKIDAMLLAHRNERLSDERSRRKNAQNAPAPRRGPAAVGHRSPRGRVG